MSKFDVLPQRGSDAHARRDEPHRPSGDGASSAASSNDTPRMLMLTGQLYDEATICRVALAYEQATEWKDRHPTLA